MTSTESVIHEIGLTVEEAKSSIDLNKALERLYRNKDFKAVIINGYLNTEPVRLSHLLASPELQYQPEASRQSIHSKLRAVGELRQYFINVHREAEMAIKALQDAEEERLALLAEEASDE